MSPDDRFTRALELIDAANAADPHVVEHDGGPQAKALLEGQRVSTWLVRLYPQASEALRLAARAHHLERWKSPRSDFPMTREGYLQWRAQLKRFHAERAGELLAAAGYDADTIARVQALVRREKLKLDAEVQALEDAICLAFLQHDFDAFGRQHDDDKVIAIVRKTWAKMSAGGHEAALALTLSDYARSIVGRALGG
ncbi:DUF4202 domain-containing protein [Plasticicumulans acidivorans]|uniref:Uncharacterized protein DUF4202 n=1 Tax=Plasticicumulans acidivorans TaxID=886464 RepID=A0A317N2N1_9GAMM|nr:DUF4202 domain-containing protein [Plasticicumulans acidivorans]PWV64397.1 uncharacterized protein DUF4202 [Plasticicumulans acidivorans]